MGSDLSSDHSSQAAGHQRLPIERLRRWRGLKYGMFCHYGLYTYSDEVVANPSPSLHAPDRLDVGQWVRVARDAGMRYMILSAKHINDAGFALWPTRTTDFNITRSPVNTDIIGAFVSACEKHGVKPALYLGGDTHRFGLGQVNNAASGEFFYVTREYLDYFKDQLTELLAWYGPIEEVWIDGPRKFGVAGRAEICAHVGSLQPDTVVAMNGAFRTGGKGAEVKPLAWPSDLVVVELSVPPIWGTGREERCSWRALPWGPMGEPVDQPLHYYMPMECCILGHTGGWFWGPNAQPRTVEELLGIRLLCHARNANCVLNFPPDRRGLIPEAYARLLGEVRQRWESLGVPED